MYYVDSSRKPKGVFIVVSGVVSSRSVLALMLTLGSASEAKERNRKWQSFPPSIYVYPPHFLSKRVARRQYVNSLHQCTQI